MGFYNILRRIGLVLLHAGPRKITNITINNVNYGERLKGKKIVITGGSKGIGKIMAKRFSDEKAQVLITGRDEVALREAAYELGCKYIVHDVTNIQRSASLIDKCKEIFGGSPDCLICNAGISLHESSILAVTEEEYDRQFDTNLKGAYFLAQAYLEDRTYNTDNNCQVLFISSETGDMVYDIPYGLSKSALNSLVGGLSKRFYKSGIRINAISPGLTVSNMTNPDITDLTQETQASGRLFLPEEIAEVAIFLLSDASRCISGEIIHCNAGNHLKTNWE